MILKTELDLSDQNSIKERFQPNFLSKVIVKTFQIIGNGFNTLLPATLKKNIDIQFANTELVLKNQNDKNAPSFDMLRACVNLSINFPNFLLSVSFINSGIIEKSLVEISPNLLTSFLASNRKFSCLH